ncbi:SAC3 domain-containing protein 1 isoform X1 [Dermacentor andersoni]|uniref:SAC3 domain-containing protein 1 isoform X1 n=1 Tax=Dermacentor andersoni TaxID=34620 RepID=UPI0021556AA0|nr:SAC3 domain-containing protein 1-like isoform X1 [Dermacentor andersoni]
MRARRGRGRAGDRYDRRQTGRGDTIDAPRQTTVIGTCQDMCPPRERQWREKERLLHPFEIAEGTESDVRPKADRNKAIKQFSRSAAGQREATPDELRPPQVLLMTTAYLMRVIAPSCSGDSWADTYHFVWDRLWAVRQDMTIQDLNGGDCIEILEQAVRFYVYSAFRCFEEDVNAFDPHINSQHLQECLKRLLIQYQQSTVDQCRNRPEMEAIYILHNLGSFEALNHALTLPKEIRNHSLVKISLDTSLAHRKGNFIRVLKNYRTLPSLLACALHSHLELIRRTALQVMTVAFSSKNCKFPLSVLGHWLSCSDHTARELCRLYQLPVQDSEVNFLKGRGDFTLKQLKKHHDSALMKVLSATDIGTLLCPDDKRQPSQLR